MKARRATDPAGSRLLDGPFLASRGLGVDGPSTATSRSDTAVDRDRLRRVVRIRLAVEVVLVLVGAIVALVPAGVSALLVVGIGLLLVGVVGAAFDLVILRGLRVGDRA